MSLDVLVADIKSGDIYDFLRDGESKEDLLKRAEGYRDSEIVRLRGLCGDNPKMCMFKESLEKFENSEYKVMSYKEYQVLERERILGGSELQEISEEQYDSALGVLEPFRWCTVGGVEMFCMREAYSGTYTTQYAKYKGKYYSKMVDWTDESTWIHNIIME